MNAITDEFLLKNGFLYKNPNNSHLSSLYKCGERNKWRTMIEKVTIQKTILVIPIVVVGFVMKIRMQLNGELLFLVLLKL